MRVWSSPATLRRCNNLVTLKHYDWRWTGASRGLSDFLRTYVCTMHSRVRCQISRHWDARHCRRSWRFDCVNEHNGGVTDVNLKEDWLNSWLHWRNPMFRPNLLALRISSVSFALAKQTILIWRSKHKYNDSKFNEIRSRNQHVAPFCEISTIIAKNRMYRHGSLGRSRKLNGLVLQNLPIHRIPFDSQFLLRIPARETVSSVTARDEKFHETRRIHAMLTKIANTWIESKSKLVADHRYVCLDDRRIDRGRDTDGQKRWRFIMLRRIR